MEGVCTPDYLVGDGTISRIVSPVPAKGATGRRTASQQQFGAAVEGTDRSGLDTTGIPTLPSGSEPTIDMDRTSDVMPGPNRLNPQERLLLPASGLPATRGEPHSEREPWPSNRLPDEQHP